MMIYMPTAQVSFDDLASKLPKASVIKFILLVIFVLVIFKLSVIFIPPGYVGVVYDRGRGVLKSPMREGINFAVPFWQSVTLFDTKLQEYTMAQSSG